MFGPSVKWFFSLFKQILIPEYVSGSGFFGHIFFNTILYDLRITIVYTDIMHAENIMQHLMHVYTWFCAYTRICAR
jgi:hypothetical protein